MTGKNRSPVTEETLINKLPFGVVKMLSLNMDIDRKWERFVTNIPRRLNDVCNIRQPGCEMRYNHFQIRLFEDKLKRPDGSPTNAIINDWATQNPRVKHLLRVLQEASLYEAADYLFENVLHKGKAPRLSDETSMEKSASLPHPAWNDAKKLPEDEDKIAASNFNSEKEVGQKENMLYKMKEMKVDKEYGNRCEDSTYTGLNRESSEDHGYRMLGPSNNNVIYTKGPSYTSGEKSMLLEGGNPQPNQLSTENDLVYDKARPVEVYSYADQGRMADIRTPCENSDEPNHTKTDLFKEVYQLKELPYNWLREITNDFDMRLLSKGGRIIGTGGFGDVFLGIWDHNESKCAVKRLKNREESEKQFERERDTLNKYRHTNIVCLYAYSIDGPERCLVYEYLSNGSLEDRLEQKDGTKPISVEARVMILQGIAEGITFLNNQAYVHRDIKSANILLDENFRPKIGDFATARIGTQGNMTQALTTSVVVGTTVYLAPEAKFYEVTSKLDSYSFGWIILEVLTGLPPLDVNRKERDLMSYVDEYGIHNVLDNSGGNWKLEIVDTLMDMSEWCTQQLKSNRCNVSDILPKLKALS